MHTKLLKKINPIRRVRATLFRQQRSKQAQAAARQTEIVLMAVGNITISWAGVERILDELIAWYQHHRAGLSLDHPREFGSKVKYLDRMLGDPGFGRPAKAFLIRVRGDADDLAKERNRLIHGLLHPIAPSRDRWQTQRVLYEGPVARLELIEHTVDDLQHLVAEIGALAAFLAPRVWVMTGSDPRRYPLEVVAAIRAELGMN